jgi:hypothetical protein
LNLNAGENSMVPLMSLWMPIVLSAVAVFVVSAIVHMVLPHHKGDFARLPAEDDVTAALRSANPPPGDYVFPYAGSMAAMNDPDYLERYKRGPVGVMTLYAPASTERPSMTKELIQWFVFTVVVSLFAGYLASRAVGVGAEFWEVVRFSGTVAFAAYALGAIPDSIWWKRKWSTTVKTVVDGLVYSVVTGVIFAWMWP